MATTDLAKVRFLLEAGCSVEAREAGGMSVLHMAAYVGSVPLFELLVRHARHLLLAPDLQGYSVLHTAAKHARLSMVQYLCAMPLSLPALRTKEHLSAAHVAAGAGAIDVFNYLTSPQVGLRARERCVQAASLLSAHLAAPPQHSERHHAVPLRL